jgi:hypothetical protein
MNAQAMDMLRRDVAPKSRRITASQPKAPVLRSRLSTLLQGRVFHAERQVERPTRTCFDDM